MFLHIGGSRVIAAQEIVGIFNFALRNKQCNKEYLQTTERFDDYYNEKEIKSFIVTRNKVGFSPIAPGTLQKRFNNKLFDK